MEGGRGEGVSSARFNNTGGGRTMMRSASRPYMQWRWLGLYLGSRLAHRMYSMILCSPSPGTSCPEKMIIGDCHAGSVSIFFLMKNRRCFPRRCMNEVPGVMQLESKASAGRGSPLRSAASRACSSTTHHPSAAVPSHRLQHRPQDLHPHGRLLLHDGDRRSGRGRQGSAAGAITATATATAARTSSISWADRKRRARCWFIFALGAQPGV